MAEVRGQRLLAVLGQGRVRAAMLPPTLFGFLLVAIVGVQERRPLDLGFLALVAMVVLGATAIALVLLHAAGRPVRMARHLRLWIVLLCCSAVVSVVLSPMPGAALIRGGVYLVVVLLAVVVYSVYRGVDRLSLVGWSAAIVLGLLPFLGYSLIDIASWHGDFRYSNVGTFWNLRHVGTAGFLAAMSASALAVLDRRLRMLSLGLTWFALFAVIASGSRGALLAWVCFIGLLWLESRRERRIVLDSVGALLAAAISVAVLDSTGVLRTPNLFGRVTQGWDQGIDEVSSGRLDVWSSSLHAVNAHPWFGQGPDAYRLSECCVPTVPHTHNIVLQLMMEFGAVGCLLLMALVMRAVIDFGGGRRLISACRATPESAVLSAMIAAFAGLSMIDGQFYWFFSLIALAPWAGLWFAAVRRATLPRRIGSQSTPMENAASRSCWE